MITREEFLKLYKKYISGQCSPAEMDMLNSYRDKMKLLDDKWDDDLMSQDEVGERIWQRLSESRKVVGPLAGRKNIAFKWYKVAAAAVVILSAGLWMIKHNNKPVHTSQLVKTPIRGILPGGNKAYLTMANGTRIVLDSAKNGNLAAQAGITLTKTKNGLVVYHFSGNKNQQIPDSAPEFNTITTPVGGQYQVELEDGTKVWLNSMSSLRFPVAFNGNERNVELTGEAYFEVAKNKYKPFNVQAAGTRVQVLGTHFNINAYKDNEYLTATLLEGSVRMVHGSAMTVLTPGQQGKITTSGNQIEVKDADIEETMAWKNGLFVFHDENIVNIMKQVSRWYDIDVEYTGDVKDREFGGTVSRYKNITELLNNMELTQAIHYKIEGRRVIIMK